MLVAINGILAEIILMGPHAVVATDAILSVTGINDYHLVDNAVAIPVVV